MKMKKLIATAASLVMVFGAVGNILPNGTIFSTDIKASAFYEDKITGKCGEDATYELNRKTRTLTIKGTGAMTGINIAKDSAYADKEASYRKSWNDHEWESDEWAGFFDDLYVDNYRSFDTVIIENGITEVCCIRGQQRDKYRLEYYPLPLTVYLPDSVEIIKDDAFSGSAISSIVIPKNCTEIGEKALSGCKNLQAVTFLNPDTVIPFRTDEEDPEKFVSFAGEGDFSNLTVYGYRGSTAEKAKDLCHYNFVPIDDDKMVTATFDVGGTTSQIGDIVIPCGQSIKLPEPYMGYTYTSYSNIVNATFSGWDVNGELYQPGDTFTLNEDTRIIAKWENEKTTLSSLNISTPPIEEGEKIEFGLFPEMGGWEMYSYKSYGYIGTGFNDQEGKYFTTHNHAHEIKPDELIWLIDYDYPEIYKFEEGKTYTAEFYIGNNPKYNIDNDTIIRLNGKKVKK